MADPYHADESTALYLGDNGDILPTIPDASIDAVVTDPPAGIRFMNRAWDGDMGGRHSWVAWLTGVMSECYRTLKPGGHALVWAIPRTSHWTAWALEDAGFEMRDCIVHLYGSGFPKSLDVSKAIDKTRDDRAAILEVTRFLASARDDAGLKNQDIDSAFGFNGMAGHWTSRPDMKIAQVPQWNQWCKLRALLGFGEEMDAEVWRLNGRKGQPGEAWAQREVVGERTTGLGTGRGATAFIGDSDDRSVTAPATDAARQWDGWGTALKPAAEHWWLARKPLEGTVAANVVEHGTGALNIDACRGAWDSLSLAADTARRQQPRHDMTGGRLLGGAPGEYRGDSVSPAGRWPTNLILTHSALCEEGGGCATDCPVGELDRQSGVTGSNARARKGERHGSVYGRGQGPSGPDGARGHCDAGGASRFFPVFRYEAKAPTSERPKVDGVAHETVKPLALMRFLVRLITPPGGTVLDPFLGSGTTAEACIIEGFNCVGIERDERYLPLIRARIGKPLQPVLGEM